MLIQEAVKSGLPLRRPRHVDIDGEVWFLGVEDTDLSEYGLLDDETISYAHLVLRNEEGRLVDFELLKEDIMADDWMIKEIEVYK